MTSGAIAEVIASAPSKKNKGKGKEKHPHLGAPKKVDRVDQVRWRIEKGFVPHMITEVCSILTIREII